MDRIGTMAQRAAARRTPNGATSYVAVTTSGAPSTSKRGRVRPGPRPSIGRGHLIQTASVRRTPGGIDSTAGCSIKDSFASLDLTSFGFSVLFDAEWKVRRAVPVQPPAEGPRLGRCAGPGDLPVWEQAWRGPDGPSDVLRVDLLDENSVDVLAARTGNNVVAGAVLNRSAHVVGMSNFFSIHEAVAASWAGCLAWSASCCPERFSSATNRPWPSMPPASTSSRSRAHFACGGGTDDGRPVRPATSPVGGRCSRSPSGPWRPDRTWRRVSLRG